MSFADSSFKLPLTREALLSLNSYGMLGALGIQIASFESGTISGSFEIGQRHLAPNGYLHAGSIVALADTLCGVGCQLSLPDGALTFTTIELKSNFLSTTTVGMVSGVAAAIHSGRTTQVWDCRIESVHTGRIMAEFRCTQLIIYPGQRDQGQSLREIE